MSDQLDVQPPADVVVDDGGARHPSWGVCIASAAPVVGLLSILFPLAPFWAIVWMLGIVLLLRFTPLGSRWLQTEKSALLSGFVAHPVILRHPRLTAVALFALPIVIVVAVMWQFSDPNYLWNGGVLWISSIFGYLAWTVAIELRAAGHQARWWNTWLTLMVLTTAFVVVGGPARARWAYCEDKLADAVTSGEQVTKANTGRFCWWDAEQLVVDGQTRLYTDQDDQNAAEGEGLVYSPDGAIEKAGGIEVLIDLGEGWYWFETGSPVRNFWFDA